MPGHKMGRLIPDGFGNNIFNFDVTEVPGTDNMHYPTGAIKEAQLLAAEAFGCANTYFLVNGSTCGIYSMILSVCNPGDKIIVSRDCHKSVINALILVGAIPVYMFPEFISEFGITGGIDIGKLKKLANQNRDAKGVIITYPSYYGICSDIKEIAKIVHENNMILMVDEAHGTHFKFSDKLPISSLEAGADICVQSAHKTIPSLTQSSYLHISKNFKNINRLEDALRLTQTTSPSYILMMSLDCARNYMQVSGQNELDLLIEKCNEIKKCLIKCGITIIGRDLIGRYGINDIDITRIVVNSLAYGISGFQMETILKDEYNIQVEMSDIYNIIAICTVADKKKELDCLKDSLIEVYKNKEKYLDKNIELQIKKINYKITSSELVISPREAYFKEGEFIPIEYAESRISKSIIAPYPPGIPIINYGENITKDIIQTIDIVLSLGGTVNGINQKKEILVVKE
jgi:lysine decarboxylase